MPRIEYLEFSPSSLREAEQRGIRMAWEAINKWILPGKLPTVNATERRNGMVSAANEVAYLMDEFTISDAMAETKI